ncbi:hypothetical protein A3I48_01860 [Candidatus Daviesbacteria bacterium RIFCSPLOWO2_02_FULL_36_7]|uniref:Uncharacterized protein n=1 Tax=Candidatus Daviesbacteria bacterium RIFCSPLOWO2_02_FULL_36_7 TaxID=1797792 RepID=A0A1F5MHD8_9BACT|nr:MAG: hypothetical protein A3I48_01860 [Candidatus Daviesbacteria bacterium RIFCSPLOWO2_02_FULL_36_7]
MSDSFLRRLLIFTDETVEAQRSLEKLLPDIFTPMGYEVLTYDLHQVRERKTDVGEIINVFKPQTVLWQLSVPFRLRLEEFINAEKLKPQETRFILLSPIDESIINRVLEKQFGDQRRREIVFMPFEIDELVRSIANESIRRGKERE